MAFHQTRHIKKCERCEGTGIVGYRLVKGFFSDSKWPIMCSDCKLGLIFPKQVIVHLDRAMDTVIY